MSVAKTNRCCACKNQYSLPLFEVNEPGSTKTFWLCWDCMKAIAILFNDVQATQKAQEEKRLSGYWNPITKARFVAIATEFGANHFLASDLWYFRPVDHANDTEDEVTGNLQLMKQDGWIQDNNAKAEAIERHAYQPGSRQRCSFCDRAKRAAEHNTEPIDQNPAATIPPRLLT